MNLPHPRVIAGAWLPALAKCLLKRPPLLRCHAWTTNAASTHPSGRRCMNSFDPAAALAQNPAKPVGVPVTPDAEILVRAEDPPERHVSAKAGDKSAQTAKRQQHHIPGCSGAHGTPASAKNINLHRRAISGWRRLLITIQLRGSHVLPPCPLSPRYRARRARGAGALDRYCDASERRRTAQCAVGQFTAPLQCGLRRKVPRRHASRARLLRGTARAFP
jgi:hypothetical protein